MADRNAPKTDKAADEAHTETSPEPAAGARHRNEDSLGPPDAAKQAAYPLRDNAGWPTGRGPGRRRVVEEKERDEHPEGLADQRPTQDQTGVVAPPQEGEQPGVSGELGGTPGAPAAGPGRQID